MFSETFQCPFPFFLVHFAIVFLSQPLSTFMLFPTRGVMGGWGEKLPKQISLLQISYQTQIFRPTFLQTLLLLAFIRIHYLELKCAYQIKSLLSFLLWENISIYQTYPPSSWECSCREYGHAPKFSVKRNRRRNDIHYSQA